MTYSGKKGSAMNITVYLGASRGNDPSYEACASALGAWIADHGHTLIYGGSRTGLMGALSAGALKKGGTVIGVEPQEFIDTALQQEGLTKLIVTPDMASRKAKMMELGDLFLAFPGGFGTLEEISQVMSEVKLGHLKGRFAFLDFNGYYQPMKAFLNEGIWQLLRKRERYINSRINGLNKRLIKRSKMSLDSQITLLTII